MKQLEELEKKIVQIVNANKTLKDENSELKQANKQLKEQSEQLQASLLKESTNASSLAQEKNAIKSSIKDLLSSISSLESAKQ